MESKFIIFVVLAILEQMSVAQQSEDYGLSKEATATLTKISFDEKATIEGSFDGFNPVFDILVRLAAKHVWNLTAETDDSASQVAHALVRIKEAIDYSWDATSSVVGEDCAAVEEARTSTHSDLDHIYSLVSIAVELAKVGKFSGNETTVEDLRLSGQKDFGNLVDSIYGTIRTCVNTNDKEVLAAIELSESGLRQSMIDSNNAFFDAVKILTDAIHTGSKNLALISAIEDARSYALAALSDGAEHRFSLLKALLINSELGLSDAAFELNSIQYAETVSRNRWIAAVNGVYETLAACLRRVALGLSHADDNVFSLTDAAQAKSTAKFMAGFQAIVDSILIVNPNAKTVVAPILKLFAHASHKASASYYGAIVVTQSQDVTYAEAFDTIETYRKGIFALIKVALPGIFELIQIDKTWEDKVAAQIEDDQDDATTAVTTYVNDVFDCTEILLNATYGIENSSEDDFTAVQTSKSKIAILIADLTYIIAAARITALIKPINLVGLDLNPTLPTLDFTRPQLLG